MLELRVQLGVLRAENVGICLNRKNHGLTDQEVGELLLELRRRGWLRLGESGAGMDAPEVGDAAVRAQVLAPRKPGPSEILAWLTPRGGAEWEAVARPRWDRFIDYSEDEDSLELLGQNPSRLKTQLHWPADRIFGEERVISDVTWDLVAPWQATYWKTLPAANRVRARIRKIPVARSCCSRAAAQHRAAAESRKQFHAWYTPPF